MSAAGAPARWLRFAGGGGGLIPVAEARAVAERFGVEMDGYCELLQAPGGSPRGLMVRGEEASFTERAQAQMSEWQLPGAAREEHAFLARFFEHKRAFLKLEWWRGAETGSVDHLVAFYFRRRPQVGTVLDLYRERGAPTAALDRIARTAALLGKESIHFVAGALRTGRPIHRKLYFSQYVTPTTHALVLRRLQAVLELFEIDPVAAADLRLWHPVLMPPDRIATLFVSLKLGPHGLLPGLKLDYPRVSAGPAAGLAPPADRANAEEEIRTLCAAAARADLSYLGVTLSPYGPLALKYYADLPSA